MKSAIFFASASMALAAVISCATSDEGGPLQPPNEPGPDPSPDASAGEEHPDDGAAPIKPSCSSAGWCLTSLPDGDLTLKDIWPLESRAFAIAESPVLGVKVLEWNEGEQEWSYIDDNSQNAYGSRKYAGKIWAPHDNEIYYGVAPRLIYHGRRVDPSSPWSWQRSHLDDNGPATHPERDPGLATYADRAGAAPHEYVALGVWGTSAEDVYAWYGNTVFRKRLVDGEVAWVPEYIADDPDRPEDRFFIFGATGSSPEDVWFAGGRARYDNTGVFACPILVHRSEEDYRRLVDNVINDRGRRDYYADTCHPREGVLAFHVGSFLPESGISKRPWTNGGWLTSIASAGPGAVVGVMGREAFAYVDLADGGSASLNSIRIHVPHANTRPRWNSVWLEGTSAWMSGWGLVIQADEDPAAWRTGLGLTTPDENAKLGTDAASYRVSTIVLDGAPLDAPIYQIRGTSNTNLWAVGARYALHKTTP